MNPIQIIKQDIEEWEEIWSLETSENRDQSQQQREIIQNRIFGLLESFTNTEMAESLRKAASQFVTLYVFQRRWSTWKAEYDSARSSKNNAALVRLGREWDERVKYLHQIEKPELVPGWCTD